MLFYAWKHGDILAGLLQAVDKQCNLEHRGF